MRIMTERRFQEELNKARAEVCERFKAEERDRNINERFCHITEDIIKLRHDLEVFVTHRPGKDKVMKNGEVIME